MSHRLEGIKYSQLKEPKGHAGIMVASNSELENSASSMSPQSPSVWDPPAMPVPRVLPTMPLPMPPLMTLDRLNVLMNSGTFNNLQAGDSDVRLGDSISLPRAECSRHYSQRATDRHTPRAGLNVLPTAGNSPVPRAEQASFSTCKSWIRSSSVSNVPTTVAHLQVP
jgi:hypothetical protein